LGGRMGDGQQWMSWIALEDVVDAIMTAMVDERVHGPINVVAPTPVRNDEFTATLARVLHRPRLLPAPKWALRLVFGQLANETVLASMRVLPAKLQTVGYRFRQPEL